MNSSQYINQDSGKFEYYTPTYIIEAVRDTLRQIDLDPASSVQANLIVQAKTIYTIKDDGLSKDWFGNVWLNHPFSRRNNPLWITKLITEYKEHYISAACCITYASTSEKWFRPLLNYPQCFLYGRTNYMLPNGKIKTGVTKGSVITYLGNYTSKFNKAFKCLGAVKIPY